MMGNPSSPRTQFKPKGEYIIWVEKEGRGNYTVYSTNSVFWRDFFK